MRTFNVRPRAPRPLVELVMNPAFDLATLSGCNPPDRCTPLAATAVPSRPEQYDARLGGARFIDHIPPEDVADTDPKLNDLFLTARDRSGRRGSKPPYICWILSSHLAFLSSPFVAGPGQGAIRATRLLIPASFTIVASRIQAHFLFGHYSPEVQKNHSSSSRRQRSLCGPVGNTILVLSLPRLEGHDALRGREPVRVHFEGVT